MLPLKLMSHWSLLQKKIISPNELAALLADHRKSAPDSRFVFTNGCFDILHRGHVEYLNAASDLGDHLIVAVNSDDSVRRQNKGLERPINQFRARSVVLAALECVAYVVEFDEDTPLELIRLLKPDVLVKGGDYDPHEEDTTSKRYIVGRELVLESGGEVKIINLVEGFSTTSIIQKLKK